VCVPVIKWIADSYLTPVLAELCDKPLPLPPITKKVTYHPTRSRRPNPA